jgi:metal-responsive CopG/Arc/MetJ family transcriptional regulator
MEKVSVSITSEHLERIESRADEDGTGRSAALRAILDDEVRRRV